ncbi:MAG: crossover junction endodeoxyribonuclease RuvC [Desulfovibrio sp.]|jgi:crossover junction endodeoxyribonuclease RuvC|nr:crossover junction endodeoxyribonuclease RuvC [Desulfovibrio sp.]
MATITVIGIDPGSQRTGWGVISETSGVLRLVECGVVRAAADGGMFSARLARIYRSLAEILGRFIPGEAAVEQVFTAKNIDSTIKLAQARGVAVAACAAHNVPVYDYAPALIKKSLVGTGRAEKEQVAFMVAQILNVRAARWPVDASDALATAVCHLTVRRYNNLKYITK